MNGIDERKVSCSLNQALWDSLAVHVQKTGLSRAQVLREAIARHLVEQATLRSVNGKGVSRVIWEGED